MTQNYCPNFVSKNQDTLETNWDSTWDSPCDGSGGARASKLGRDTCLINTNRFHVILGRFGQFENFVHFRSFRSFHEPGTYFRATNDLILYKSIRTNILNRENRPKPALMTQNYCPNFVSKNQDTLETNLDSTWDSPCDGSGGARASKLGRDTCYINTNRSHVILSRFGQFENFVHFRSFRSFHEPGTYFRATNDLILYKSIRTTILNRENRPKPALMPQNYCPNFVSKNQDTLETNWDSTWDSPCDGSGGARASKLGRDTCYINTNRSHVILSRFGQFENFVHFRSFRSFHEPRTYFRVTNDLILYKSIRTTILNRENRPKPAPMTQNYCPNFVSKNQDTLETNWDSTWDSPFDGSGGARASKLGRDTCYINTNRSHVILSRFGQFENFVHFRSFRSFHEPGTYFRATNDLILYKSIRTTIIINF